MATGNLILGTMSGKLGDVVAYTNNGKQCARVRRRVVRNPNTAGQQVQRMILSTAAQFASILRPVLNNGFEGIQKGAPSLAYARKEAMRLLRTAGMWNTDNGLGYNAKGSKYLAPNKYLISRGSLFSPQVLAVPSGIEISDRGTISATANLVEAFPWAEPGMQLTFIAGEYLGSTTEPFKVLSDVRFVSFVPKDNVTPLFVASDDDFKINPAAIEAQYTQGNLSSLVISAGGVFTIEGFIGDATIGALIYSSRDGSRRSTSYLAFNSSLLDDFAWSSDVVVESYETAAVDSGAPAEYYLDNNPA